MEFFLFCNATHCDYVLMSTVRVFCWLMTCALSISSVLDNFCQIAPLHSNAVWMTRVVLHLICKAHTHTYYYLAVSYRTYKTDKPLLYTVYRTRNQKQLEEKRGKFWCEYEEQHQEYI